MKALVSFVAVLLLALIGYAGASVPSLRFLFGVVIPYAAFVFFVGPRSGAAPRAAWT